ncbi:hypothetical protein ABW20_dc0102069 [Dactylellina cionopaga]|nr:hypothetical protein ABW20_dc0102069 [Dactylellina cionopaga]
MSRLIDALPPPKTIQHKRLIVLSRSRVGTMSMYRALKLLGYKPYHTYEIFTGGITQMNLYEEALRCKYLGKGKPYNKTDFDKWLANYDAILAVPQYFTDEFIEFYPEAHFIYTYRDVDSWVQSMSSTVWGMITAAKSFPLTTVSWVDPWINAFCTLHNAFEEVIFQGKEMDTGGAEIAKLDYQKRQEKIKQLSDMVNMKIFRLEDGVGWEQICPFLGHKIPGTPYPKTNTAAEFQSLIGGILHRKTIHASIVILGGLIIPILAYILSVRYF